MLHDAIIALQIGVPYKVLERDSGPRKGGSAIGLWPNAFRALDALGVAEPLRQKHPLISRHVSLQLLCNYVTDTPCEAQK